MSENLRIRHWFFSALAPQLPLLKLSPPQLQKLWLQLLHLLQHLLQLQLQPPLSCLQCPQCHHSLSKPNLVSFPLCLCAVAFLPLQVFLAFHFSSFFPSLSSSCRETCSPRTSSCVWRQRGKPGNRSSFCHVYFFFLHLCFSFTRLYVFDKSC